MSLRSTHLLFERIPLFGLLFLLILLSSSCVKSSLYRYGDEVYDFGPFLEEIPQATDDYGYTPENPILMGYSNDLGVCISFSKYFLANLTTEEGISLEFVRLGSMFSPIHQWSVLDHYELTSPILSDTIDLYVDIYHKDKLRVPQGLKFVGRIDTTSAPVKKIH